MNYFYADENSQTKGPYTAEHVRKLYRQGTLKDTTWLIEEGSAEWKTYASLFREEEKEEHGIGPLTPCMNCGVENGEGSQFCEACGMKLDAPPADVSALGGGGGNSSWSAPAEPKPAEVPATPRQGFTKHAFISHSSRDHALAERVCEVLESHGLDCWIAPRDIAPGCPYDEEILRGIECSQTFILLLSDASNESPHVKRELMCALRAGHAVYPIRIQEVQPGPKLEYLLEGIHWVDAWTPPIEAHLDRLAQLIANPGPNAASSRHAKRNPFGGPLWRRRRNFAGVTVAILALLTAGWAASTWKAGVISGIVSYLTQQLDLRIRGVSSPSETETVASAEVTESAKCERHKALLDQAAQAASNRQWQAAVNAYEAALALFDDEETRAALAQVANARDLEQVAARKRDEFNRLLADAEQAEKGGDFAAAQKAYERAAAAAPTDAERAQVQEKARRAHDGISYKKKKAAFDELMLQAREAEGKQEWQGALDLYEKAVAASPDETLASQARILKSKVVAFMSEQALLKPKVNHVVMLSWTADAKVVKRYPSSDQILNAAGEVIGEVSLNWGNFYPRWEKVLKLSFAGRQSEKKETVLCEFRSDDPVGQTRFGKIEGVYFSGRVSEVKGESTRNGDLASMTIQVTATCDAQNLSLPNTGSLTPAGEQHAMAQEATSQDPTGMADLQKRETFDDLMQQGQEAEEKKDWQGAKAFYLEALAVAPDAKSAAQVRACGTRVVALLNNKAKLNPPVNQTVTLGVSSRRALAPSRPAAVQIRDESGKVIGTVSIIPDDPDMISSVTLTFKGNETTPICDFNGGETAGTTKAAEAEGLSFTGRLLEVAKGHNGARGQFIKTITVRITATRAGE